MPVLKSEEADFETRLSGTLAEAFALARSFDAGAMRIVQSRFDRLKEKPPPRSAGNPQTSALTIHGALTSSLLSAARAVR